MRDVPFSSRNRCILLGQFIAFNAFNNVFNNLFNDCNTRPSMSFNGMQRSLFPLPIVLAGLCFAAPFLCANVDPLAGYKPSAEPSSIALFGDTELATGLELSDTTDPACPFPIRADSAGCDATDANSPSPAFSADGESAAPLFLLSVIALPQPSEAEVLSVQPQTSAAAPQEPFSVWLLVGITTAIALIGGGRILRFWRASANRA